MNRLLGPVLMCWLLYSIYLKLKAQNLEQEQLTANFYTEKKWLFIIAILLMPINWCIEAKKWQRLVTPLHDTHFLGALRGVLSGMAISIFLPNRMGEFGGRVIQLPAGKRLQGIALSITGSLSQLLATVIFGTIALWVCNYNKLLSGFYNYGNSILPLVLNYIGVFTSVIITMIFWRIPWLFTLLERIPFIKKFVFALQQAEKLTNKDLAITFLLSSIRYFIFVVQYALMLQVFNVPINITTLIGMVSVYYLILAVIPSITFAELGIRGKVAIAMFASIASNHLGGITIATSLIFVINLLIPAVLGSIMIARIRSIIKD